MVRTTAPSHVVQDSGADGCTGKLAHPDVGIASDASALVLTSSAVLEGVAARGEERLLEGC
jgi:hypothetical protein